MFKIILLVFVAAVFGAALLRAARWLLDALLVLLAATASGILAGRLLSPDTAAGTAAGMLVFAVLVPSLWKLRGHLRRDREGHGRVEPSPLAARAGASQTAARPNAVTSDDAGTPWARLVGAVPEYEARLAVAGRSFDRFRTSHAGKSFDTASHQTLIMIDRRLPELINAELGATSMLAPRERHTALSALVDLAENLAADCERQLGDAGRYGEDASAIRLHIERFLKDRRAGTL